MPLEPGATFGRYQLAELLGRGGMGEVYSAYDSVLHRKVALKVLTARPEPSGAGPTPASSGPARILREARSAAGITHPNAVSIYDVGEVDGVPFLAMELVAGRTLRSFIGDSSVALARRIRWITDVARALGAAHQLGVVHRDIKPENVMVRDDGFVKVLDFGIARRAIAKDDAHDAKGDTKPPVNPSDLGALAALAVTNGTLTADGIVMGTPMYMAPEQIRAGAIDGRADQFAWGVLAFEVLMGKTPWEGEGIGIFSQILSREIEPLSTRNAEIPTRVDMVVRKAMNKAPDARFRTMEEVAEELESFAATGAATTTGRQRISIPTREMALAATEQIAVTSQNTAVENAGGARTQESGGAGTRGRSWRVAAAVVGVAAVVGAIGVRGRLGAQGGTAAVTDAGPVDVPSQMSTNPDATAAYRAGVQGLRDGSAGQAETQFDRAIALDPLFGAAQLRRALTIALRPDMSTITSADLQGAHAAQASLGTRDRTVLEAFELIAREPPDYEAGRRKLEAAMQTYPSAGDFPFQLGLLLDFAGQASEAVKAVDASIARDPSFAFAWRLKGDLEIEVGEAAAATEAFDECLKVSPGATSCLLDLATIQVNEGKCEEALTTTRRLIPLEPDEIAGPHFLLAEALAGLGEPEEAVHAALSQYLERAPARSRQQESILYDAAQAILGGDFATAEQRYVEFARTPETLEGFRFEAIYPHILLDLELRRPAEAIRLAEGYLRERTGMSPTGTLVGSLAAQAAELAAGGLTREAFVAVRDSWLAKNRSPNDPHPWIEAYARPAETQEDARAALTTMPKVHPLLPLLQLAPHDAEPVGRVLVLAGRPDEGIPYLKAASASCLLLKQGADAIYATRASLDLGLALEDRGDVPGACAAYQRVVTRWGKASPSPNTAVKARKRQRAIGCSP